MSDGWKSVASELPPLGSNIEVMISNVYCGCDRCLGEGYIGSIKKVVGLPEPGDPWTLSEEGGMLIVQWRLVQ